MSTVPNPLIVVVEDEPNLLALVTTHLDQAGMIVQGYASGLPALKFLRKNFASLLLLDINLPGISGFELRETLTQEGVRVPTIFLTGNTHEEDKLRGLGLGDDYMTKPFSYAELIARIQAVLRRASGRTDFHVTENASVVDGPFDFCGVRVVPARLELEFPGAPPEQLGRKALGVLVHLHANRGEVLTREALIHAVWGEHANITSRSLDQYITKIRELFRRHGRAPEGFRNVHGVGYILDPEAAPAEGG